MKAAIINTNGESHNYIEPTFKSPYPKETSLSYLDEIDYAIHYGGGMAVSLDTALYAPLDLYTKDTDVRKKSNIFRRIFKRRKK